MKYSFLFCLAILIFSCTQTSVINEENMEDTGITSNPESRHTTSDVRGRGPHYNMRMKYFKAMPANLGSILFIGNSLTEGGDWQALLHDNSVINHGIGGDLSSGVVNRLHETIRQKPRQIFLMIGTNDLAQDIERSIIIQNIFTIVKELSEHLPETEIIVQSLLPVNTNVYAFLDQFDCNQGINKINQTLSSNETNLDYTFVNLHKEFIDKEGMLNADFTPDGIHLNELGYRHWVELLRSNKLIS